MSLQFPVLPRQHNQVEWPAEVITAHSRLSTTFQRGQALLSLNSPDPVRSQHLVGEIFGKCLLLLEALESEFPDAAWVPSAAEALFDLGGRLKRAIDASEGAEQEQIHVPVVVREVRVTGKRGRPRKVFDMAILREALQPNRRISLPTLARVFKVNPKTLRRFLRKADLSPQYANISDEELDAVLHEFRLHYPKSGVRYATGFLTKHRICLQRNRVRASLKRVSPVMHSLLKSIAIVRRDYYVPRPGSLIHLDGHHKLIQWAIVIHGFVDGYSRKVLGLQASADNKASTVLVLFLKVTDEYGFPSRVRGDRGSENIEVSVCMNLVRGLNRASFIWGTSTHNTRIECLWVEVGTQFARAWRAFFMRLERLHRLKRDERGHIWLLHWLFLADINQDCKSFMENWNNHPISRRGNERTPEDLYLLGKLEHGELKQPDNIHPSVLSHYGPEANIAQHVRSDVLKNVHYDAVSVPESGNPFPSQQAQQIFEATWAQIESSPNSPIPTGFRLRQHELGGQAYPTFETIPVARKATDFPLPFDIWWPRAVRWAQGLTTMTLVLESCY